jgi:hypothetical protein
MAGADTGHYDEGEEADPPRELHQLDDDMPASSPTRQEDDPQNSDKPCTNAKESHHCYEKRSPETLGKVKKTRRTLEAAALTFLRSAAPCATHRKPPSGATTPTYHRSPWSCNTAQPNSPQPKMHRNRSPQRPRLTVDLRSISDIQPTGDTGGGAFYAGG